MSTLCRFKNRALHRTHALLLGACDSRKESDPPAEIIGTYKTNDPRYEGLYFRIAKDKSDFSTAERTVETYTIVAYDKLEKTNGKCKLIYHLLHGKRDGQELDVVFSYEPPGSGSISFSKRPELIWSGTTHC